MISYNAADGLRFFNSVCVQTLSVLLVTRVRGRQRHCEFRLLTVRIAAFESTQHSMYVLMILYWCTELSFADFEEVDFTGHVCCATYGPVDGPSRDVTHELRALQRSQGSRPGGRLHHEVICLLVLILS